jgi:hypothetical protein
MGVPVGRISVGGGSVGGRKGDSVAWGAQAEVKIKTTRKAIRFERRGIIA